MCMRTLCGEDVLFVDILQVDIAFLMLMFTMLVISIFFAGRVKHFYLCQGGQSHVLGCVCDLNSFQLVKFFMWTGACSKEKVIKFGESSGVCPQIIAPFILYLGRFLEGPEFTRGGF